ncbi:MAG: hypothetical protein CM15mP86_11970 [Gammaproteobacteria bacterium]|nr:MAG: hypothetical protein CM15mP86_11970 [Gammaproteobacteria bacterium]
MAVLDAEGNETGEMIETGETRKGVAKENHYLLKMALYSELKKDLEVLPIYEILVQHYPKKRYWTNLSGLYGQKDRQMDQMGALEAAYDDRLLDKQREFTALSQLLFMFENPRKAAEVIEDGLNQGIVKREEKLSKRLRNTGMLQESLRELNLITSKLLLSLKKESCMYF